jgi:hypothetical protein
MISERGVRTQIWHKADQADATGQTGVFQQSDRWGGRLVADPATATPV